MTLDLVGKRFGRLVVTDFVYKDRYPYYHCVCDCGNVKDVMGYSLTSGNTKSCGCLKKGQYSTRRASRRYQGRYDKYGHSRIYSIWNAMNSRCYNPKMQAYPRYGGRGIEVCAEWRDSFQAFHDWAAVNGYGDDLTLDRIDSCGDYGPDNCRWVSLEVQNNNRRDNVYLTCDGERMTIAQWARRTGASKAAMYKRYSRGWSDREIIYGRSVRNH